MQPWNDESFSNYDSKTQNQQRKRLIDLATLQKKKKKKKKKRLQIKKNKKKKKKIDRETIYHLLHYLKQKAKNK